MSKSIFVTGALGTVEFPLRGFFSQTDAATDGERFAPPQTPVEYVPAPQLHKVRDWAKEHGKTLLEYLDDARAWKEKAALLALLKEIEADD